MNPETLHPNVLLIRNFSFVWTGYPANHDSLRSLAILLVCGAYSQIASGSIEIGFIDFVLTVESRNGFNVNIRESEYPEFDYSGNINRCRNHSVLI